MLTFDGNVSKVKTMQGGIGAGDGGLTGDETGAYDPKVAFLWGFQC